MNIAILGAGAWGTGIAVSLAQRHAIDKAVGVPYSGNGHAEALR